MDKYGEYLKTDYWITVSKAVKARAGYRCQICNSQHDLQAHHRTYDHRGKELDHLDDLICLCRRCHETFHGKHNVGEISSGGKKSKSKKPYVTDEAHDHQVDMPPGSGFITLTPELIFRLRTSKGGFTNATLRAVGLKRPLERGWPQRMVGLEITSESYLEALKGRNFYRSGRL